MVRRAAGALPTDPVTRRLGRIRHLSDNLSRKGSTIVSGKSPGPCRGRRLSPGTGCYGCNTMTPDDYDASSVRHGWMESWDSG